MTSGGFNSFQLISMSGLSEEIFRFPNFKQEISSEIISNFIKNLKIIRQEYISNAEVEFRNYSKAINTISESLIELRENLSEKIVNIYFLTIGGNNTRDMVYLNPIRKIKVVMEDLKPFNFNIINFNGSSLDRFFKQIANRFNGTYIRRNEFRGIINSILKEEYKTYSNQYNVEIEIKAENKEFKKEDENLEEKQNLINRSKQSREGVSDVDSKEEINEISKIIPTRKADNILDKLKENSNYKVF